MKKWLDNYGKKENENAGKSSGPSDIQTTGTFNKGRDYSPAWGGQFKDGGSTGYNQSKESIESARNKPGGSNVGKYNPNQTFAGPSGGSPRGSYPIGDIGHAKSALKLAHHAPNPSGIKEAVYRKYPELKKQDGGFMQPNDPRLPSTKNPWGGMSSELASSIGGEGGEPAYLIPTYKRGEPLFDPRMEYDKTGEHLGGPFKTWQEADKWEQEVRHPYVEKGLPIPTPIKTWGEGMQSGGSIGGNLPGVMGNMYSRNGAPNNGKYAKKTLPSAQSGKSMDYYKAGLDFEPKTISQDGVKIKDPKLKAEVERNNRKLETKAIFDEARYKEKKKAEAKEWVGKSMQESYKSPLMQPGILTPEGALIAGMQQGAQSIQDVREGNYGKAAMNAGLAALPLAGKIPGVGKLIGREASTISKEIPPQFMEEMRVRTLPESKNIQAASVLTDLKGRLKTPEGIRRAKALGIDDPTFLENTKLIEDNTDYAYAKGRDVSLHKDIPQEMSKTITRHEIEHLVQNQAFGKKLSNARKLPPAERMKVLNNQTTELDDILSDLELRKEPSVFDKLSKKQTPGDIDISDIKDKLSNKQDATDYFHRGSGGKEKSAFAAEAQQYMLDKGIIKHPYENITPEKVKEAFSQGYFDKENPIRLFQIMKGSDKNYETISKALNKMLSITAIGAAATQIDRKQQGGIITDEMGQWKYPGEITRIPSNDITMKGVPYDVLGISDTGDKKLMKPGKNYKFKGNSVTEYPKGKDGKQLKLLDDLVNFTNYNKKQTNWLDNL